MRNLEEDSHDEKIYKNSRAYAFRNLAYKNYVNRALVFLPSPPINS